MISDALWMTLETSPDIIRKVTLNARWEFHVMRGHTLSLSLAHAFEMFIQSTLNNNKLTQGELTLSSFLISILFTVLVFLPRTKVSDRSLHTYIQSVRKV